MTEQPPTKEIFVQGKPIISDVPLGMPTETPSEATILARQSLFAAIAESEAREFEFDVCPTERGLLRVIGYDDKGKPNRWICPECKKETAKTLKQKYNPHPKSYIEFTTQGTTELPLKAQEIANDIKANYLFKTDRENQRISRYDDEKRIWRDDGAIYLMELLPQILRERNSESIYKNTLHCLKSVTYEEIKPSRSVIAVQNGFLHLDKRTLIDPTPNEYTTIKIPHKFNPEAKCPQILKALTEIVGEKQLTVLQEAIGNIFIIGMLFHKITIFIGSGGNGKGQVLALINHLVGPDNISNVTLQALCSDKYERATCYRKMANLGCDIPQEKISSTGNTKMMSGDDPMTMQHKYGHPFTANPDDLPKQFYSCNQLPPCDDDTDAWYRRQNLIAFNNRFIPGINAVLRLADKLAENEEEMSGFLNWVLDARDQILKNGCFSANENIEENREKYVKNSNSAQAYIEANLVYENKQYIVEKELWSKVGLWCIEKGIASPRNKGSFTQELTRRIPQVEQTTARVEGKVTHVYMNVRYKEPDKTQPKLTDQIVTGVTTVTTSPILPDKEQESLNIKRDRRPVTLQSLQTLKNRG